MSDFEMCPRCKEYAFLTAHRCDPKWKIFHEEYLSEDFDIIHAYDYEEAAKKYAEIHDRNTAEYAIVTGGEMIIQVEPFDGGERKSFNVTGESEPVYYAKEIKNGN